VTASIHASAVLVGSGAVLIRGPSGAGKSALALGLLQAAQTGAVTFARLVADDRVMLDVAHGRLLARPVPALEGLLEVRGLGLVRLPFEPAAVVSHVVDLESGDAVRLPSAAERRILVRGVELPRLAVAPGCSPLPFVIAFLALQPVDVDAIPGMEK
jgi:serine kinase of HPr protein (carbohydrate metabolism regulator)